MYKILDYKAPSKKVSAHIKYGNKIAKYVATATRENVIIYEGNEVVGGMYTTVRIIKKLDLRNEDTKVFGEWEDFKWLVINEEIPKKVKITFDKKAQGNSNKIKGKEYESIGVEHTKSNLSFGKGESVEDFLYKPVPIEKLQEENNLEWAKSKDYRILVEDDEINEFIDKLSKTEDIVGFDTETTGLLVNRTKLDKLVGMSFSLEEHTGVYIPFRQERFENVKMGEKKVINKLRPYIDKNSKKVKKLVTHNGGFDWKVMKMYGMEINIVFDTYIRQCLKAIGMSKNIAKLKDIVSFVFGYDTVELEDMYEKRNAREIREVAQAVKEGSIQVNEITKRKLETAEKQEDLMDFRFASRDFVELYGPADGDFPRLLHKEMDKDWDNSLNFIYRVEMEQIPVLGEQEYYGVRAVKEGFEDLYKDAQKRINKLQELIFEEAGVEFNINSSQQKADVLFEQMKIPKKDRYKTDKGAMGTGKAVLKDLEQYRDKDGNVKYPIAKYLRDYSKVKKLIDSFYGKLPKMIVDGYIFTSYHQLGTSTGRISNSRPNLQQTEETSRKYMIPDSDDYYFLICDYSQVEYRLMAGLAGEKKVVDFFKNNAEADYHIMAYSNMMKKPYEDVTSEERKDGKTLNFGTSYGLEDRSLAMSLFGDDSRFSQKKAAQSRKDYFDGVKEIRDYFEKKKDEAEKNGYALTMFKRRRDIEEFKNGNKNLSDYKRGSGRRKGGNLPVQGTAADILKMAMARVRKFFRDKGYYEDMVRLVMNIHDEIVVQVHKSINPYYATSIIRKAMEMDFSKYGFPPLYIGSIVGYSWYDGEVDELEAPVYLLDEKQKEVDKAIEKGIDMEGYDDPRKVWRNNIDEFSLRVIDSEFKKGFKNKDTGEMEKIVKNSQIHSNGRLMNYGGHFGSIEYAVILEVVNQGVEKTYKNLDYISQYKTTLSKSKMKKIKNLINKKNIGTFEDASSEEDIVEESYYFGEHKWSLINWLLEEDYEDVYNNFYDRITDKDYEKIEFDEPVKKEGKDITEEYDELKDYIKKEKLKYNKKENRLKVIVDYDDIDLFKHIDSMLVAVTGLDLFKEDEQYYNFSLVYENGEEYKVGGYKIYRKFLPLIAKMLKKHIAGSSYFGIDEEIEKIGGTLLKDSVKNETYEKKKLKKMKDSYQSGKSEKGRRKLKKMKEEMV